MRARREKLKAGTVREEMVRARGPPAGLHDAPASGARPEKLSTVLVRDTVEFSKERAEAVATNGQLLLTFTNKIRLDFATTWVWHVRRLKMTNWLVGATDAEALVALRARPGRLEALHAAQRRREREANEMVMLKINKLTAAKAAARRTIATAR